MNYRIETDILGDCKIPEQRYYGINTQRAINNFALSSKAVNIRIVHDLALIKMAAATVNSAIGILQNDKANAIVQSAQEVMNGKFDGEFVVNSLQGGAGTSTNMNVNEVIANRAIELLNSEKGDYSLIHPLNDVNMSQSTNDVYPTAVRISSIRLIRQLSQSLAEIQDELQKKENEFSGILKLGRTQLMDALPMTVGQGFGAYAQAIARDRWRIYKVEERLRYISIGGTAIGTGLNALPKYIYMITDTLQELTGFGLSRAESPMDITQNADVFVEVSGLLKACAVNLLKISNDLRLLASGPIGGIAEVILPNAQAGSTIMPGKVNPVIPEMVAQVAIKVISNDYAITQAAAMGQLELNAFLPIIAESLLESLELLDSSINIFKEKCIKGIRINEKNCSKNLEKSTAMAAGLINHIGYDKAAQLAKKAINSGKTLRETAIDEDILDAQLLNKIFSAEQITKPGIPGK